MATLVLVRGKNWWGTQRGKQISKNSFIKMLVSQEDYQFVNVPVTLNTSKGWWANKPWLDRKTSKAIWQKCCLAFWRFFMLLGRTCTGQWGRGESIAICFGFCQRTSCLNQSLATLMVGGPSRKNVLAIVKIDGGILTPSSTVVAWPGLAWVSATELKDVHTVRASRRVHVVWVILKLMLPAPLGHPFGDDDRTFFATISPWPLNLHPSHPTTCSQGRYR